MRKQPPIQQNEVNPLISAVLKGFREDRQERGDKEELEPEEERRRALVFVLSRAAEKHGRKKALEVRGEFLGKDGPIAQAAETRRVEVQQIRDSLMAKEAEAKTVCDTAIKALQDDLDRTLRALRSDADERTSAINKEHTAILERVREDMELRAMELEEGVSSFRSAIDELSLEDLQKLAKDGAVQVGKSSAKSDNGSEWLTIPGGELRLE
jgi:hypothetical protein